MSNYTLTNSEGVKGWVSFYSYYPDYMVGMNSYFYTFKGGNLYRHNTNSNRNTFYQDWWSAVGLPLGAFSPTTLQSVINNAVLENKLFKTIYLQGDSIWDMQLETDLQVSGFIDSDYFEKKEAAYFAFVRNDAVGQLSLRSLNGIGNSLTVTIGVGIATVNFSISPLISIGDIVSIGDYLYYGALTPQLVGEVTNININYPAGVNQLVIDTTIPGTVPIPGNVQFFLYIKNSVAESHGVLGHYCKFTMQNDSNSKIELFAVEADAMKSFP